MKNLPNKVQRVQALGIAGEVAKGLHSYNLTQTYPLADSSVVAGGFVQEAQGGVKGASGVAVAGKILGVCLKDHYTGTFAGNEIYPHPDNVAVLSKGAVYIETESPAKVGQFVFIKTDNGTLAFGDTKELADHTYTGFKVLIGTGDQLIAGAPHEIIVIVSE